MHLMKLSAATAGQRVRLVTVTTTHGHHLNSNRHPQRYDIWPEEWIVDSTTAPGDHAMFDHPNRLNMFRRLEAVEPDGSGQPILKDLPVNDWVFVGDN